MPECFDFLRGRCYRGQSCRYMHHKVEVSGNSRHHRSKQKQLEVSNTSKNSEMKEENKNVVNVSEHMSAEPKRQQTQSSHSILFATEDGKTDMKTEDTIRGHLQAIVSDDSYHLVDSDKTVPDTPVEFVAIVPDKHILQENSAESTDVDYKSFQDGVEPLQLPSNSGADILKSFSLTSQDALLSVKSFVLNDFQGNVSDVHVELDKTLSDSSQDQASLASLKEPSHSEPSRKSVLLSEPLSIGGSLGLTSLSEPFSVQFLASKGLHAPSYSSRDTHPLQLPLPPPPPPLPPPPPPPPPPLPSLLLAQCVNAAQMPHFYGGFSPMPQIAPYPLQPAHGNVNTYHAHLNDQHMKFSLPPNTLWTSLPQPPQPISASSLSTVMTTPSVSSQPQHNAFAPRNDSSDRNPVRPYPAEFPSHSHALELSHRPYPSMLELHPPSSYIKDFKPTNQPKQPFSSLTLPREDCFSRPSVKNLNTSSSLGHDSSHLQPLSSSNEFSSNRTLPFSGDLPPCESSRFHPYAHNQQSFFGSQYSKADGILGVPVKSDPISQPALDLLDRNKLSSCPDFGGSSISTNYNPYASTFEQPLGSKFSFTAFSQDKVASYGNKYDTTFNLNNVVVNEQRVGCIVSRQTTSSPDSARAVGQSLPRAGSDQYDPLLDSIEPSSSSKKKNDHNLKEVASNDSDFMVRLSSLHKPLDFDENRHEDAEAVASAASVDNDEYGETADAELHSLERSLSSPAGVASAAKTEVDQSKPTGKTKKKKDSRSTKLFKVAIANFVKEVLKPSWRQGNMSKEAFKTIVKKTVDKVSGAMKSHRIPKSQEKINQYISSSQRKLTKLVMVCSLSLVQLLCFSRINIAFIMYCVV